MVITIETSRGKTFEATFIGVPYRKTDRLILEIRDKRRISEVADDFDGLDFIEKRDDVRPKTKETYEGYSRLSSIADGAEDGTYRMMLEIPKE